MMRDRLCRGQRLAPTLTRGHVTDEVGRLRQARLSPASHPGSLRDRRVSRALLRFKCSLVPRKRRSEYRVAPTLALPRERMRESCLRFYRSHPCGHEREWASRASTSELFLLTLLRLRGRVGEGVRADEVIR